LTRAGDYRGEMNAPYELDDATAEAILAGRAVPADLEPVARLVAMYRDAARWPVRPSGELAALLAKGGFEPAPGRGRTATASTKVRRTPMAWLSRLAGLSIAVKAIIVAAIGVAGLGTAAAAGVLPDPVQDRVDAVVGSVIDREPPAPDNDNAEFGDRVSEDAKDGGVVGPQISEQARQQGDQHRPTEAPGQRGRPTELPTPDDIPANPPTAPPAGPPEQLPTPPAGPRS
jgi:hypothetical protein